MIFLKYLLFSSLISKRRFLLLRQAAIGAFCLLSASILLAETGLVKPNTDRDRFEIPGKILATTYLDQINTLFIGYFGRPPSPAGVDYYGSVMDQSGGDWAILADDFWNSSESQQLYSPSLSTREKINLIYQNLFSRDATADGLDYWQGLLDAGLVSLPEMAYTIAYNATADDEAILDAKRTTAELWTLSLDTTEELAAFQTDAGRRSARSFLAGVNTSAPASLSDVDQAIAEMVASSAAATALNDTGIVRCSSALDNNLDCPTAGYPSQDAQFGRDATSNDPSDGHAGFSFTKLDDKGEPLPANATTWACVRDNVTGLIWEVKTDDAGLHDRDWTYTWYNPDPSTNGEDPGLEGGGLCESSTCDTLGFVEAVNAVGLCGATDWRLPTRFELVSIASLDRLGPAIDLDYFPNTLSSQYWSATADAYLSGQAWVVYFSQGGVTVNGKHGAYAVRLVRSGR